MNGLEFDPAYSAGIRDLLIVTAARAGRRRRRRLPWSIGLTVAGLSLLGAGGAVAAAHLLPGSDVVTRVDRPHALGGRGTVRLELGRAPAGTDSLELTLVCDGGGTVTYPDGASQTCGGSGSTAGIHAMPWTTRGGTLRIGAPDTTTWRLTYRYSHRQPTALATNASGRTYGVDREGRHPDLIAVVATNGRQGYIDAEEAAAVSCADVRSPAEALACGRGRTPTAVPVYESDGVTRIGTFRIG